MYKDTCARVCVCVYPKISSTDRVHKNVISADPSPATTTMASHISISSPQSLPFESPSIFISIY